MIAWIDLETTGLDTECSIIEVAAVVTDDKFNQIAAYESICYPTPFGQTEEFAVGMHINSGLWSAANGSDKSIEQTDRELEEFLTTTIDPTTDAPAHTYILGGQSVHFDRGFVERWMPLTADCLSHRQIDVSGLKLMWSYALGIPTEALPPEKSKTTHRAMDDILASIDAARWYADYISMGGPVVAGTKL